MRTGATPSPGVPSGRGVKKTVARRVAKADLPTKICASCGLPFTWRKKWAASWSDVKFCSERCRRTRSDTKPTPVS